MDLAVHFCKSEKIFRKTIQLGIIQSEKDKTFNKGPGMAYISNSADSGFGTLNLGCH